VLGTTFDGHAVIDGELIDTDDAEHQAADDQDGPTDPYPHHDADDGSQDRRQTLADAEPTFTLPNGGYMPADEAMEQAANSNRAYRRGLTRR